MHKLSWTLHPIIRLPYRCIERDPAHFKLSEVFQEPQNSCRFPVFVRGGRVLWGVEGIERGRGYSALTCTGPNTFYPVALLLVLNERYLWQTLINILLEDVKLKDVKLE